jgi:benzylsuccinate CoA-transferase BbsF subunit
VSGGGVLSDVKVADFSWIGVGPITSLWLSWHGATTVRLESTSRVDGIRFVHPFKDGVPGVNRGAYYACYNVNKLGMTCNLNTERGREVARRLIEWADVVVENFTPKAMRGWGLDYASIIEFKPDVIMLSASLQGQDGPEAMRPGFGNMLQGMAGFNDMIGWPDRGPSSVSTTYTDWLVPYFGAAALTSALIHKQRTGEGQYIDLSQFESAIQFLGAEVLDGSVNGHVEGQVGNDLTAGGVRYVAPHGVYPCSSPDGEQFVALAAFDDEQWSGIVELADRPAFKDERFATNAGRCEHAPEIDSLLESWTRTRPVGALVEDLVARGVPAAVVQTPADLDGDPQLAHRGHFVPVPHTEIGEIVVDMPGARLGDTPAAPYKAGPCLGEDNEYVYQKLLGYSEEEYYELLALGVVELWEH